MPHASDKGSRIDEFRDLLKIDKYALDDDLVEQPDLLYRVSEQHAFAASRRDAAKLELERGTAERAQQLRLDAAEHAQKLTETGLAEQLSNDSKVMALKKDHIAAIRSAAEWSALLDGFRDRSSALKGLVQLYASNYFSTATGSAPRSAAVDKMSGDARERVQDARRERGPSVPRRHSQKEN